MKKVVIFNKEYELGAVVDVLAGEFVVEYLGNKIKKNVEDILEEIKKRGASMRQEIEVRGGDGSPSNHVGTIKIDANDPKYIFAVNESLKSAGFISAVVPKILIGVFKKINDFESKSRKNLLGEILTIDTDEKAEKFKNAFEEFLVIRVD